MIDVVHLIDSATPADAVEQMLAVREAGEAIISLGPPPRHTPLPAVRCVHRPMGSTGMAGRSLRRALPTGATAHAWSVEAAEAGNSAGVAVVLSLSEATDLDELQPLPWSLARLGCRIEVPTSRMHEALLAAGVDNDHMSVVPPAVAPQDDAVAVRERIRRDLGIAAEAVVLVAPAEMTRAARHRHICWAHAICGHADAGAHLLLPGGGTQERAVRYFSRTTGFDDRVLFTGASVSRRDALAAADTAIFAGDAPAGATILAETVAAGLATIATAASDPSGLLGTVAVRVAEGEPQPLSRAMLAMLDERGYP
jgi:hypothetical protein